MTCSSASGKEVWVSRGGGGGGVEPVLDRLLGGPGKGDGDEALPGEPGVECRRLWR